MITFLPSPNFEASARLLDDKRLGAQRYEAWSILKWLRNPADYDQLVRAGYCRMWRGYEPALVRYTNAMLREWARRGKNNKELRPEDPGRGLQEDGDPGEVEMPPWMGDETLHSYHRHALMAKLPEHYGKLGWVETGNEYNGSYPWPICLKEDEDGAGSDVGSWVLRWPKSVGLDPVPISVGHGDSVGKRSKSKMASRSKMMAEESPLGSNRALKTLRPMKATTAKNRRTAVKHKLNNKNDKRDTGVSVNQQQLRRSARIASKN